MELLVKQRHKPEVVNYLRSAVCGYDNLEPKVCCTESIDPNVLTKNHTPKPKPVPVSTTTTVKPVITPVIGKNKRSVLPEPGVCGVNTQFNVRVVGGTNASLGAEDHDHHADHPSKRRRTKVVNLWMFDRFTVRLGDLNLYRDDDGAHPVEIPIADRIIHPGYNPTTFVNDIAILRMEKPVTFTKLIRPVCLPIEPDLRTKDYVNRKPFIAGWGTLSFNGPSSDVLQQLQVPVVSEGECRRAFEPFKTAVIDSRVVCAGYLRGGKDACKGDSGGPLMDYEFRNKLGVFYQIGVVSYGYKCAEPGFPGVYTRVSKFADWIIDNLYE
ncbi:hypothetical protein RUM44_000816 [Polyplax serrata]|uniref:CLIP domain-containing serine protease n=1 Tax=Polyplax serrata TaxID=468196 RepID=A0ABR1B6B5_POLSC